MEQEKQSIEENPHLNDDKDKEAKLENVKIESELNIDKPVEAKKECDKKEVDLSTPEKSESVEGSKITDKPTPHESPGLVENFPQQNKSTSETLQSSTPVTVTDSATVNSTSTTLSTDSTTSSSSSSSRNGDNTRTYSSYKDIEKDSDIEDCLMTKVILYSLQNKLTVDNSRLDMAKNKYMMNSTNNNPLFSSNSSNSSDSNLSSLSTKMGASKPIQKQTKVDQIVTEFKSGEKADGDNSNIADTTNTSDNSKVNTTSDNTDKNKCKESDLLSNGADSIKIVSEETALKANPISTANISTSPQNDSFSSNVQQTINTGEIEFAAQSSETSEILSNTDNSISKVQSKPQSAEASSSNSNSNKVNDSLDFRDKNKEMQPQKPPEETTTLDLTTSTREKIYDDKSVPPIKRNHALYVGIPDFSKPIFTAPTVSKTTTSLSNQPNKIGDNVPPKMKTPDFASVARSTAELQMRKPDFSKGFSSEDQNDKIASNTNLPVNEKNLAEICRQNNYISDLQLKPPSSPHPPPLTSTYKIDYKPSTSQSLIQNDPSNQNVRRDPIVERQQPQQILIDEPMAHIIHKNQFLPPKIEPQIIKHTSIAPHLLGGSSTSGDTVDRNLVPKSTVLYNESALKEIESRSQLPTSTIANPMHNSVSVPAPIKLYSTEDKTATAAKHLEETKNTYSSPIPHQSNYLNNSQEDLRKYNPAHYPYMPKDKQYIRSIEQQERSKSEIEFSLKQKEHQLRQEGTIITIKNESTPSSSKSLMSNVDNRDYSRPSTTDPSRIPKESTDYYRDYKLKQNIRDYVPSKDASSSSIIQHTGSAMPPNARQSTESTSSSSSVPSAYPEYQKPNLYSHSQQSSLNQQNDYRYDQMKSSAFRPVEHTKSPVPSSVIYTHPNDLRGLTQTQNIKHSTSPVFHAQANREMYYAPSPSSRSYGSPSPIHGYPQQHPHGKSPAPVQKIEGQMNPPQNWPPTLQSSSQRIVASPVDRLHPSGSMTSQSPTNTHSSPKPNPSPVQSPVHHVKASPSPHSNPSPYGASTSQNLNYGKYSTNYPSRYPEYQENKDHYAKSASFHSQQQKYPESQSIQYGDFSRHFDNDRRKYPNSIDSTKYSSQESLNKNVIKDNLNRYGSPSNEYHNMRHASSDTNLNQSGSRYINYPDSSHLRKSETDLNSRENYHQNIDPSRHRNSNDNLRLQMHHSGSVDYKPNVPYNPPLARKDINPVPQNDRNFKSINTAGMKTASTLEIRPVESQRSYGYPSTSNYTERKNSDVQPADLATISKVKVEPRPIERSQQASAVSKVTSSVFVPVKRESPLDLSVKTVKTKADSTGCDDLSSTSRSAAYLHKIEFTPNFGRQSERQDIPPRVQQSDLVLRQPVNDTSHRIQNIMQKERFNMVQNQQVSHHSSPQNVESNMQRILHPPYGEPSRKQEYHHHAPSALYPERHSSNNQLLYDNQQRYRETGRPQAPMPMANGPMANALDKYDRNTYPPESKHIVVNPEVHRPGTSGMPVGNFTDASNKIEEAKIVHPNYNSHIYKPAKAEEASPSAIPQHNSPTFNVDPKKAPSQKFDIDAERKNDRELVESILYNRKRNSVLEMQSAQTSPHRNPGQFEKRPMSPNRKRPNEALNSPLPNSAKLPRIEEPPHLRRIDHMNNVYNQPNYIAHSSIVKNEMNPQERAQRYHSPHQLPYNIQESTRQQSNVLALPKRELSMSSVVDNKYYADPRYPSKEQIISKVSVHTPPPLAPTNMPYRFGGGQYYPDPKAEMINRNESRQQPGYKYNHMSQSMQQVNKPMMTERLAYPQQNFYSRPDDVHLKRENVPPLSQLNSKYNNYQFANKQQTVISENVIKIDHISGHKIGDQKAAVGIAPHFSNLTSSSNMGSNGNIARGADQNTISKLRNSLEQKELQKLKSQKSIEISEDENKTDTSPRQFRTKGELKGFNPVPFDAQKNLTTKASTVENFKFEEPMNLRKDMRENRNDSGTPSAFDIMDWGSACNDFVEQLQTGKKRNKRKRYIKKNENDFKIETVDKPIPFSELPGSNANISEVPIDIVKSVNKDIQNNSSSEDEKPLHLLRQQSSNNNGQDSNSGRSDKLSEKSSRDYREKQRIELAQKIAARLGKPSSSESESESRRPPRTKLKVRRLRTRSQIGMKKTSDENSDDEECTDEYDIDKNKTLNLKRKKPDLDTSEEEAANVKTKINNAISKLEELTSSESDHENTIKKIGIKVNESDSKNSEKKASGDNLEPKANQKNLKLKKSNVKTTDTKKIKDDTSPSESEESDDDKKKSDKKLKVSSSSNKISITKKKATGNDSGVKKLLAEEETMTRSKRKLEIERKLSNSKVLRNDKVVQNIAPDRKKHAEIVQTKKTVTAGQSPEKNVRKKDDSKRKIIGSESEDASKPKPKNRRISKISSSEEESEQEELVTER